MDKLGKWLDGAAFALILAGAVCAECIPLAALLLGLAGVLLGVKRFADID